MQNKGITLLKMENVMQNFETGLYEEKSRITLLYLSIFTQVFWRIITEEFLMSREIGCDGSSNTYIIWS